MDLPGEALRSASPWQHPHDSGAHVVLPARRKGADLQVPAPVHREPRPEEVEQQVHDREQDAEDTANHC